MPTRWQINGGERGWGHLFALKLRSALVLFSVFHRPNGYSEFFLRGKEVEA
jgi:hypothetical protein